MSKMRISEVVKKGKILVSDAAWGTFLYNKELQPGECPAARISSEAADPMRAIKKKIQNM